MLTKRAVDREIATLCLYRTWWARVSRPQRFRVFLASTDASVRQQREWRIMKWKWNNVPIPDMYLVGLLIGFFLHRFSSKRLFRLKIIRHVLGWPFFIVGLGLCVWSVLEAKDMNITHPNILLKSGPYAHSRNPMYVGWTFIYLGISFVANSVWMVILLPIAFIFNHIGSIRKEERLLHEQFGDEYKLYQKQVRRYI